MRQKMVEKAEQKNRIDAIPQRGILKDWVFWIGAVIVLISSMLYVSFIVLSYNPTLPIFLLLFGAIVCSLRRVRIIDK